MIFLGSGLFYIWENNALAALVVILAHLIGNKGWVG